MGFFAEFADNGLSGSRRIVAVNALKWAVFGGHLYVVQCDLVG